MRAVVITRPGDPDVLQTRDVPKPQPEDAELLIRVVASGVNRADVLQRLGRYPAPEGYPPDIPGLEYVGVVEETGRDVEVFEPGDAVMGITGGGAYAEFVTAQYSTAIGVPPVSDGLVHMGAVPEAFMTAFDAAVVQEGLEPGEVLLIHAVGSGVGTAGLQLALRLGANVIGTSRTATKLAKAAELGLEHAVSGDEHWPARIMEITDGRGVDVILDLVGGAYLEGNQRVLAHRGRHIVVGVPSGPTAEIDLRALMSRRGSIRGTVLRARSLEEKAVLTRRFQTEVIPGFQSGELAPIVDSVFSADEAPAAHRRMEDNLNFGKILLRW